MTRRYVTESGADEWTHFYIRMHAGRQMAMRAVESLTDGELAWVAQRMASELERRKMLKDLLKRNGKTNGIHAESVSV